MIDHAWSSKVYVVWVSQSIEIKDLQILLVWLLRETIDKLVNDAFPKVST